MGEIIFIFIGGIILEIKIKFSMPVFLFWISFVVFPKLIPTNLCTINENNYCVLAYQLIICNSALHVHVSKKKRILIECKKQLKMIDVVALIPKIDINSKN